MKNSAVVRIVIYAVLVVLLLGILVSALAIHVTRGWGGILGLFDQDYIAFDDVEEVNPDYYMTAEQGKFISVRAEDVREIEVDWIAGDVVLVPGDVDSIRLQETAAEEPMVYSVREGKLEIRFRKNMKKISFGTADRKSKDLTITVPKDWKGREVEIHSVSADVEVRNLTLDKLEYQGVSGKCDLRDCVIRELDMETVSGRVTLTGEIQELECESVSADCELNLTNVPRSISMDGVSGKLIVVLPEDAGFTVDMDGLRKDLDTDFAVTGRNGKFVAGDGYCQIDVDGVSGSVRVLKASR